MPEQGNDAPNRLNPQTGADRAEMLAVISQRFPSVKVVDDLFRDIPAPLLNPAFHLPGVPDKGLSEPEIKRRVGRYAAQNTVASETNGRLMFKGGGFYRHSIAAAISAIAGRSEFSAPYTPYQFEANQGTLQAHYEYQSSIAELYGMDVVNTGVLDGATGMAEAVLMAMRLTKRKGVVMLDTVNPVHRDVTQTYTQGKEINIRTLSEDQRYLLDESTACVVLQYPNYFGYLEDVEGWAKAAHDAGAKLIVSSYPISLGILPPPGHLGADIAVGEGQPLGNQLDFGGPSLGIFTANVNLKEEVRQMPGRLVGETTDGEGNIGFALVIQAREQHITREKATSNICTTAALLALRAQTDLALIGPDLPELAEIIHDRAVFAAKQIDQIPGMNRPTKDRKFFNEFVVAGSLPTAELNRILLDEYDIIGGIDVGERFPNGSMYAFTELTTAEDINTLVGALTQIEEKYGHR